MSFSKITSCVLISLALSACSALNPKSYFRSLNSDYLTCEGKPSLTIPSGLTLKEKADEYAIPGVASNGPLPAPLMPPEM